jgi:hypothetical protein
VIAAMSSYFSPLRQRHGNLCSCGHGFRGDSEPASGHMFYRLKKPNPSTNPRACAANDDTSFAARYLVDRNVHEYERGWFVE